jgi:alanyl-tRNA synthetase
MSEDGAIFLVVAGESSGLLLDEVGPKIAETLGGRGGGRGTIFQGKADSLANREAALQILRDA